jgi:hypothetical protein
VKIADQHLARLIRDGYTLVEGFLSPTEVAAAKQNMLRYVPTPQELAAAPERYPWIFEEADRLQTEFPFVGDALNHVSTHPDLIDFVERALNTREVMLSQSAIWAKYASTGDFEQALHLDYQGNTLVAPREDGDYRQVNIILYYTDVAADMGPTCIVPLKETRDEPLWPTFRPRNKYAALYKKEIPILASAGSLLIFSMSTFHRASEMTADAGVRLSHHMVWRSAAHAFQGFHQWSQMGEKPLLQRFIERASPRQREVLGFPAPTSDYWNAKTVAAVAARYPKMDMTPYQSKNASRGKQRRK